MSCEDGSSISMTTVGYRLNVRLLTSQLAEGTYRRSTFSLPEFPVIDETTGKGDKSSCIQDISGPS